jgi:hypothetical protein
VVYSALCPLAPIPADLFPGKPLTLSVLTSPTHIDHRRITVYNPGRNDKVRKREIRKTPKFLLFFEFRSLQILAILDHY